MIKKNFDKTIPAQVHGSNFVIFNFPENDDFFLELCRIFGFFNSITLCFLKHKGAIECTEMIVMWCLIKKVIFKSGFEKRGIFYKIPFLHKAFHGDF